MTHFTQTKEFKKLQTRIDAFNLDCARARIIVAEASSFREKSLNEAKASVMQMVEDFDSRRPRISRDFVSASDIASL